MQIRIADIEIEVERKRVKNFNLRINAAGEVKMSVPLWANDEQIHRFAEEQQDWLRRQKARQATLGSVQQRRFEAGEPLYLWGEKYVLEPHEASRFGLMLTRPTHTSSASSIAPFGVDAQVWQHEQTQRAIAEGSIGIAKMGIPSQNNTDEACAWLKRWYARQLKTKASGYLAQWSERTGLTYSEWRCRWMTSRWGTCNTKVHRIWLNAQLAKYPPEFLDYVALHEICHIQVPNHGPSFKALLDTHMPDWRERKAALNAFKIEVCE